MNLTALIIGDIVGKPGRTHMGDVLPALVKQHRPDIVIANGENAAGGKGITRVIVEELHDMGVDVTTTGNHVWDQKETQDFIGDSPRLIRPANYPPGVPGRGWVVWEPHPGKRAFAVVNLQGRSFMAELDCPFQAADRILSEIQDHVPGNKKPAVIVDFHAETTSEKESMGFYLAGRVAAVVGTHTHVQTADERVLAGGTAYITDVGMTGVRDSVLGFDPQIAIQRFLYQMPMRYEVAEGLCILNAVVITMDEASGLATRIERICV